ncbi:MAG TPA: hypothetical protein VFZ26_11195 [Gemmatimonadales bacterium]
MLFLTLTAAGAAAAQRPLEEFDRLVGRLAGMTAVTGYEQGMVDTLLALVPGAARDRAGNAVRPGSAGRRRLVACALDEPGWVVGGVRPDGWLTLRRSPGPVATLRDQQLEGARVTVHGRRGPVPGVVAVRSIHLTRQRADRSGGPFTADSALVDLGAESSDQVARLGVEVLSVVTLAKRVHRYGDGLLAGPHLGRRAACAALVHAAGMAPAGSATIAFLVQQELAGRGLAAVAGLSGPFEETLLVEASGDGPGPVRRLDDGGSATRASGLGRVSRLALPVRYAGSPVETVSTADAAALAAQIAAWLGRDR